MDPLKVYLSGYIGGPKVIDKCADWRKQIINHYELYPIIWMNPLVGKDFSAIDNWGIDLNVSPHSVIHRDYQCVAKSDLIIVNMSTFGEERPLLGTIFELAWAWDKKIPIIMITDNPMYSKHPFTEYVASNVYTTVEDMLNSRIVEYYYKSWRGELNT